MTIASRVNRSWHGTLPNLQTVYRRTCRSRAPWQMIPPGRGTFSLIPSSTPSRLSSLISRFILLAASILRRGASLLSRPRAHSGRTPYLKVTDGKHFTPTSVAHAGGRSRNLSFFPNGNGSARWFVVDTDTEKSIIHTYVLYFWNLEKEYISRVKHNRKEYRFFRRWKLIFARVLGVSVNTRSPGWSVMG